MKIRGSEEKIQPMKKQSNNAFLRRARKWEERYIKCQEVKFHPAKAKVVCDSHSSSDSKIMENKRKWLNAEKEIFSCHLCLKSKHDIECQ